MQYVSIHTEYVASGQVMSTFTNESVSEGVLEAGTSCDHEDDLKPMSKEGDGAATGSDNAEMISNPNTTDGGESNAPKTSEEVTRL